MSTAARHRAAPRHTTPPRGAATDRYSVGGREYVYSLTRAALRLVLLLLVYSPQLKARMRKLMKTVGLNIHTISFACQDSL